MDNQNFNTNFEQEVSDTDFKSEFFKYFNYWPWFVLSMLLALSIAYVYSRYASRIYQTNTKIKILDESDGLELPSSAFVFKRSNINLENEVEILTSYRLIERVVKSSSLNTSFYEEGQIQTTQLPKLPFHFEQLIQVDSVFSTMKYKISVEREYLEVVNLKTEKKVQFPGHDSYLKTHKLPFEIKIKDIINAVEGKRFIVSFSPIKSTILSLKSRIKVEAIGEQSHLLKLSMKSESHK